MPGECAVHRLGQIPYMEAWRLQEQLSAEIAAGLRPPTLLLLEHPHTFTFGRKGDARNLLWDEAELRQRGVTVHWVDRGGDVTYHGPGQLVGYPLIPLAERGLLSNQIDTGSEQTTNRIPQADYVGYVRRLEETLIGALASVGIASAQLKGLTGVWVQAHVPSRCQVCPPEIFQKPAKIAAIGVKVDVRGISRHGFALNVDPDMSYWDGIIGCGLKDSSVVSLADLMHPVPSMEKVMDAVTASFGNVFGYSLKTTPLINRGNT